MKKTRPISWMQVAGVGLVAVMAMPALAGVIYQWDEFNTNSETTGSIEFHDGVTVFDEAGDIASFSFVTHGKRSFDQQFAFEALGGVVLEDFLFAAGVSKSQASPALTEPPPGDPILQDPETVTLSFSRQKKVASPEMVWRVLVSIAGPKTTTEFVEGGSGRWVRVQVPEPPVVLLLLAGLMGLSFARRWYRRA